MQSPPFGIIGISSNHPRQPANPAGKQDNPRLKSQLLRTILIMKSANRVGRAEEKEEQEKKNKVPQAPRKEGQHSQETACTLLIVLMNLMKHFQQENCQQSSQDVFEELSRTLQGKGESKGVERMVVAAPVAKKRHASNTYRPGCCRTLLFSSLCHKYPKDLPQGATLLIKSGYRRPARRKKQGKSSRCSTW